MGGRCGGRLSASWKLLKERNRTRLPRGSCSCACACGGCGSTCAPASGSGASVPGAPWTAGWPALLASWGGF
ncbi:hypothetical protein BDW62DRAFT_193665 [Aspergillus aurantiobrunneus]